MYTEVVMSRETGGGLVLTRRVGESILIRTRDGHQAEVTVVDISGGQVKLHTVAPRSMSINRAEIQKRIDDEIAGVSDAS